LLSAEKLGGERRVVKFTAPKKSVMSALDAGAHRVKKKKSQQGRKGSSHVSGVSRKQENKTGIL